MSILNKEPLLQLLCDAAYAHRDKGVPRPRSMKDALLWLNNNKELDPALPTPLPRQEARLITLLRGRVGERVTFISCVLNYCLQDTNE